jgi:hypothetical protein
MVADTGEALRIYVPIFPGIVGGPRVHLKGPVNLKSIEAERRKDPNQLG